MAVAAVYAYSLSDASWALFGLLILAPDLGLLGYLVSARCGAQAYNLTHNLVLPLALGAIGWTTETSTALTVALIWVTHIGIDRAVGYGLKYVGDHRRTHLQRLAA